MGSLDEGARKLKLVYFERARITVGVNPCFQNVGFEKMFWQTQWPCPSILQPHHTDRAPLLTWQSVYQVKVEVTTFAGIQAVTQSFALPLQSSVLSPELL